MMHAIKSKNEQRLASLNQRNQAIHTQLQEEQKKRDEKTARLRALRLAKEATDRKAAELLALEKADIKAKMNAKEARRNKPKLAARQS
ncbi:MAG: hypothetical protein ACR2QH_19330 [Geminicoccaceae bacterium]